MTDKELHEKAVRACEGAPVTVNYLLVYAIAVPDEWDACLCCEMDCLCKDDMAKLCMECTAYTGMNYILSFKPIYNLDWEKMAEVAGGM